MATYTFTLEVAGIDTNRPHFEDAIYQAGCDDGLVVLKDNRLWIDFDRESSSLENAIMSAASDLKKIGGTIVDTIKE